MSLRLSGINPLSYMGVEPSQPPNLLVKQNDPTANDFQNINVGTFWLVYPDERLWILISVVGGTATWVQLYPAGGGGGGASQFPTDDMIANESGGVLNIFGDGNIITHGSGNTVRITVSDSFVKNFDTDDGVAHPSSNTIRIIGGTNINTSGASDAVTVNLDNSVTLTGTLQVDGAATFGGTTTFDGNIVIPGQTNGVLQTNGAGTVTATNGTNGQLLIGGGTAPAWANLTSTGGTVIITNNPNAINLESTGGGSGSGDIVFYAYQADFYGVPYVGLNITSYQLGSGLALTTTVNEGLAFFGGDGVGTPASFTAPANGVYCFSINASVGRGNSNSGSTRSVFRASAQIITPDLTYMGSAGQPSASGINSPGGWYGAAQAIFGMQGADFFATTIVNLSMGDMVFFQVIAESETGGTGGTTYFVSGPQTPISPGSSMPITYVQGYLIKTL